MMRDFVYLCSMMTFNVFFVSKFCIYTNIFFPFYRVACTEPAECRCYDVCYGWMWRCS